MDKDKLNKIISKLQPKQKQLSDVLFATTDTMTRVQQTMRLMLNSISNPEYLARLAPEDWVAVFSALTDAQNVSGTFLNEQARIAEKAPQSVQNVFAVLAGQMVGQQQVNQIETTKEDTYELPADIIPIQNALQQALDCRFGVNRADHIDAVIDDNEQEDIIDATIESTES